ncbi:MAG: iron ABC transporter permease [Rhodoferax sp.]
MHDQPVQRGALALRKLPVAASALGALLLALALLAASLYGGAELVRTAFAHDNGTGVSVQALGRVFGQTYMLAKPLINSLLIAVPVALVATALGGVLAWLAVRTDLPGAAVIMPSLALLHVMPGFQLASAWIEIFADNGLWQTLTGLDPPLPAYGVGAILTVTTLHLLLFPYLIVAANLQAADPALEEAARVAGLSGARVFWRITVALARPALAAGLLLVFAYVMEEFGIPSLLGTPRGFDTLTTRIYGLATTPPLDMSAASVLALLLGVLALGVLWTQLRLLRGQRLETLVGKASRQSRVALGRWRGPLALAVWVGLGIAAMAPLAALVLVSLLQSWGQGYGPENWTLMRYAALLDSEELRRALRNTLWLGAGAALAATVTAVVVVYAQHRLAARSALQRLATVADRVSFIVFALPGLVVGLALILAFSGGVLPLYGSVWILMLAYTLRFGGVAVRTVAARLAQIGVELEAAGAVAGLSRLRVVACIVLPLLAPALAGSMVLVFINAVKEISATSLLVSQGSETLAYEAYVRFQEGNYTQGSALSVATIVLVLLLLGVSRWLGGRNAGAGA